MPINKCVKCGFLFIDDSDIVELAAKDAKRLFVEYLRTLGKESIDKKGTPT